MNTATTSISPQMGGKRKLSKWNKFTSKVYATEHRKNKNFKFKDALKMASAMKKKGQYGGDDDELSADLSAADLAADDLSADLSASDNGSLSGDQMGGRRRRRTMRRSRGRGRSRGSSRGRSRGRGRARASRRR